MYSPFLASTSEQASSRKKSPLFIQPGDFHSSQPYVIGPKITLPSGQMEQIEAKRENRLILEHLERPSKRPPLSLFHTEPLLPSLITWPGNHARWGKPLNGQRLSRSSLLLQEEEEEALTVQTFPLRAVRSKRATRKVHSFFAGIVLFGVSVLTLGTGAVLLLIVPGLLYKSTVVMLALIMLSYLVSAQAKRAYHARQRYLSMKQLTKPSTAEGHHERHYLTLIKQDTTGYLRAITTNQVRKGSRR